MLERNKESNKFGFILTFIGLLFFVILLVVLINMTSKKNKMDQKTTATSIDENFHYDDDGSGIYSPVFYYIVNGNTYSCKASVSSSNRPSSNTTIYYDSKNPSSCITEYDLSTAGFLYIFIGISGFILAIGLYFLVKNFRIKNRFKSLSTKGKLIKGLPYTVKTTNSYLNGHQGEKIIVTYTTPSGETKEFVGKTRYDLDNIENTDVVDLLVDPDNYNNYYIDFDIQYTEDAPVEFYQKKTDSNSQTNDSKTVLQENQNVEQQIQEPVQNVQQNVEPVVQNVVPQVQSVQQPIQEQNTNSLDDFGFYTTPVENTNNKTDNQ